MPGRKAKPSSDPLGKAASPVAAQGGTPPGVMFSRAAWARILPFLIYMLFIVIADLLVRLGWNAHDLRWLYAVKIGAVMLALVIFWREYSELNSPIALKLPQAATALAVGAVVLVLWVSLNASWMIVGTPEGYNPSDDGRIDWLLVAVRIFGAALVVPVMEELFWRSFLMRWIVAPDFMTVDPARITLLSLLITVILFGVEHNQWLAGIVAGLAYSALYVRHRTLWSPILAHALTNCLLGAWIVYTGNWTYW
jgi:CAAX prenyl protease-like protein